MLQGEHSAILLTSIKLPIVIKIFVLSIFEWLFTQVLLSVADFDSTSHMPLYWQDQGLCMQSMYINNKYYQKFKKTNSDSFTILGLWVLGLAVSHINESQLQTYESRTLFLMTSLQYYCILRLAEIKTLHPRDKIMRKRCRMRR